MGKLEDIKETKKLFKRLLRTNKQYEEVLKVTEKKINLLENIYMTGGGFSKEFEKCALKERERLCIQSSALHSLLREKEKKLKKVI
jgi:hypothetical protein